MEVKTNKVLLYLERWKKPENFFSLLAWWISIQIENEGKLIKIIFFSKPSHNGELQNSEKSLHYEMNKTPPPHKDYFLREKQSC